MSYQWSHALNCFLLSWCHHNLWITLAAKKHIKNKGLGRWLNANLGQFVIVILGIIALFYSNSQICLYIHDVIVMPPPPHPALKCPGHIVLPLSSILKSFHLSLSFLIQFLIIISVIHRHFQYKFSLQMGHVNTQVKFKFCSARVIFAELCPLDLKKFQYFTVSLSPSHMDISNSN